MIVFGGPIVKKFSDIGCDSYLYAKMHKERGYKAAVVPNEITISDREMIKEFRDAFNESDITIAEVGLYNNIVDLDENERRKSREEVLNKLALADEIGATCFVGINGTYANGLARFNHVAKNHSQDAFDEGVELARYFIDTVKPKRTYFTFEMFPFSVLDTPENVYKFYRAVDRKEFAVHLDLVNLVVSPYTYFNNGEVFEECLKLFGEKIVSCHIKDILMEVPSISVILKEVVIGRGNLDLGKYLMGINNLPRKIPMILEHLETEEKYLEAANNVRKIALENSILL